MSQQASPPQKTAVVSSEKVVVGSSRKTEKVESDDELLDIDSKEETAEYYIDLERIQKSTRFVIDHLLNTRNYNFFGDNEQEKDLNNSWSQFIETLPKETDAASKLKSNRMRMAFVASNYHVISSKNPSSKLDRDYVASLQYRKDLDSIYSFLKLGTSKLLDETGKQLEYKRKMTLENMVLNLFKTAIILSLPVPLLSENDKNVSASASVRSISKYTNKATIFNTHFQINPSPVENFDEEFINGIFSAYGFALSMFLLEVRAYRALDVRHSGKNSGQKNYIPRLYQFGYCEWQEVTQFQGFYLLIGYKDNDTLSLSEPDLFKKSSEFLDKIHVEKFFYSQKDEDAYTIDFGLPSPTRLKDFNSNKIEQDQDVIRLYKACEVEQLAPDVIQGGRYSMMPKSKRQRIS
ncbi:uncharacterized protein RJT21DRAFT_1899 [Scheffersomyces amazonensis]|uniref:uncharacterized protein n=1 Tax=Scheffersomyces amazonensis TaxID=1078765 RepID=UPI00315CDC2D